VQPWTLSQASAVHGFPSSQSSGAPRVQRAFLQTSRPRQALLSVPQAVPSSRFTCVQRPTPQTSAVHGFPSSSHGLVLFVKTQPRAGSQVSVVQGLSSLQVSATPALQTPSRHVSVPLQRLASAHEAPFGFDACAQTPPLQASVVHGLPSSVQGFVFGVWTQPCVGSQPSSVHGFWSSQERAGPAPQTPA
jgi:hypothetical protein